MAGLESEVEAILEEIRAFAWASWTMPPSSEWYLPEDVVPAFVAIASARSAAGSAEATRQLANAIGHDLGGWLYAAAVPGVRFLARLHPVLAQWPRLGVTEVLVDCVLWADPTVAFVAPDGTPTRMQEAVLDACRPLLAELGKDVRGSEPLNRSAAALLEALKVRSEPGRGPSR
ncbi:MAG: hypothetical protein ACT4QF_07450 [Sporichthyaceae bacterium]